MTRAQAIAAAQAAFDGGNFREVLARRVARPTESQNPDRRAEMRSYLDSEVGPAFQAMGFECRILEHPKALAPFLFASRLESPDATTVFGYGHGDVVRGLDREWRAGLSPWKLTEADGVWYGRGVADNKGQHTVNMEALRHVIATRGRLGFNAKFLIEMGEEVASPGLRELCSEHRELMRSDLMIASDGPRLSAERPTIFLGTRGAISFDLKIEARPGAHHSGNWAGVISNPGIQLAHAIASISSATGQVRVPEWVPEELPDSVRRALSDCEIDGGADGPEIEPSWGEPGLSPAERLYAWSSFEVLAFKTGNPDAPVHAIPPRASARCQLKFTVGVDVERILPALRRHLDRQGFPMVQITKAPNTLYHATQGDPDSPTVRWAVDSLTKSGNKKPAVLPALGGSIPNDIFTDILGVTTIWIPHSYSGCSQHAPNEHLPPALLREGLSLMTGLYWDLGEDGAPAAKGR